MASNITNKIKLQPPQSFQNKNEESVENDNSRDNV